MSHPRPVLRIRGDALREPSDGPAGGPEELRLARGVIPALLRLRDAGFRFAWSGAPDGILVRLLASQGLEFAEPGDGSPILELPPPGEPAGDWTRIAERLAEPPRVATVERRTRETDIRVELNLDAETPVRIATGLGFFDHMLEQVAKHGGFALVLDCRGDLEVDEHHTVEDCALALGQALREALGDKRGLQRYGFLLPMDESLATVAIDLSGRPYAVFKGRFGRDTVGGLPTELVPHFFRSLADSLGAAIHVEVTGENSHHMVEACFKGVGRALRQALRREGRELPSSKGVL